MSGWMMTVSVNPVFGKVSRLLLIWHSNSAMYVPAVSVSVQGAFIVGGIVSLAACFKA